MRRLARGLVPLVLLGAITTTTLVLVDDSHAELEGSVYSSRSDRIRIVIPRGWRATDHPTYPGLLLWMMRTQPPGQIVLSSEAFTRELYCSWPPACRATADTPTNKYACALRMKLQAQKMRVDPVASSGPKENAAAGLPSVWFEYDDGKHFLRQAVAVSGDRAFSLVLAAPSLEARASHVRPFDQALRSMRPLTAAETGSGSLDAAALAVDDSGAAPATTPDAMLVDGGAILDGAPGREPMTFESAPAPKIDPVGPCAK